MKSNDLLTTSEVMEILRVPRSTFYYWRQKRIGPPAMKLPNGEIRIRRGDLEQWLIAHQEAAA